jgi:hypothetical protein
VLFGYDFELVEGFAFGFEEVEVFLIVLDGFFVHFYHGKQFFLLVGRVVAGRRGGGIWGIKLFDTSLGCL